MKFYLSKKGYGKYVAYHVKSASGKKLGKLKAEKVRLFNSRKEAYEYAQDLKRGN